MSERDGSFVLLHLLPGAYVVSADGSAVANEVELSVGEVSDVTLRLGQPAVGAGVNAANTPSLAATTQFSGDPNALPTRSRAWESLAELQPGVNDATQAVEASREDANDESQDGRAASESSTETPAAGLSYEGQAPVQAGAMVDGLATAQSFRGGPRGGAPGGPRTGASFGEGAIQSFRVLPRTFSAQFGGSGGVIAVITQAGPPRLHGSAFLVSRESALAATNPYSLATRYRDGVVTASLVKPHLAEQEFGGSLGGTLRGGLPSRLRDKLALFGSVEEQVRQDDLVSSPGTANFYTLSATQIALLGNRGVTAAATNAALNYLDSLSGPVQRSSSRTLGFGRLDVSAWKRDKVTLAGILNRFRAPSGTALSRNSEATVARGRGSLGDSSTDVEAITARWVHAFSPKLQNELRLQAAHDLELEIPHAPLAQEPAISPGGLAPQVSIAPEGFAYGTPPGLGRTAYPDEQRVQLAEQLQWLTHKHLLSVGADWSRLHDRVASLTNGAGSFSYDSGITNGRAGGLVDWITDYTFSVNAYPNGACPSIYATVHLFCFRSFTQSFGPAEREFVTHELAGFVEDSFRPRTDLAITAGLRYDYTLLPLPQTPNHALDAAFAGVLSGNTGSFPEDRNNFGPRISVAWSPAHHGTQEAFTLRAGYGLFYGRTPGATLLSALSNTALASATTRIRITPSTITSCPQVANQGFGFPCVYTTAPPAAVAQTTSATVFSAHFRAPAVQRATLELERTLTTAHGLHLDLKASYAMALSEQLPSSVDRNIAPSTAQKAFVLTGGDGHAGLFSGQTFAVPLYTARRSAQYGPVTELVSDANATYHAATAQVRLRTPLLEARGSYTFSRAIDYAPQLSATPRTNAHFDPVTRGYDKGLSSLHFPQRFTGQVIATSRNHHGPHWLQTSLTGWRAATLATAGSGAPYSYAIFGGTELAGGSESINGSGGATYLPTVGRNTLRLPVRANLDLRLSHEFSIGSHARWNAFVEAFNVLNMRNLSHVETRAFLVGTPAGAGQATPLVLQDAATVAAEGLNTPAFGTPLSSTTALSRERQLEAGLRINF